jgi:hypothetical protein
MANCSRKAKASPIDIPRRVFALRDIVDSNIQLWLRSGDYKTESYIERCDWCVQALKPAWQAKPQRHGGLWRAKRAVAVAISFFPRA